MVYIGLDLKKKKNSSTFCQLDDSFKPRTAVVKVLGCFPLQGLIHQILRTLVWIPLNPSSDSAINRWLNITVKTSVLLLLSQDCSYQAPYLTRGTSSDFLNEFSQFWCSLQKLCSILHVRLFTSYVGAFYLKKKNLRMENGDRFSLLFQQL